MKYIVVIAIPITIGLAIFLVFQDKIGAGIDTIGNGMAAIMQVFVMACQGAAFVAIVGGGAWLCVRVYAHWLEAKTNSRRAINGYFPLQDHKVNVWDHRIGKMVKTHATHDPNNIVGNGAIWDPYRAQFMESLGGISETSQLAVATNRSRVAAIQAGFPGDQAYIEGEIRRPPTTAALRWAMRDEKPPRLPELPGPTDNELPQLELHQPEFINAWSQSTPTNWKMGWSPKTGEYLDIDLRQPKAFGIVGRRGTGKTSGAGAMAMGLAIKYSNRPWGSDPFQRYHPIILDPKSGMDLGVFEKHAEYYETDAQIIGEQIQALVREHNRRMKMLGAERARDTATYWQKTGEELPRIELFIEEFDEVVGQAQRLYGAGSPTIKQLNTDMKTLMSVGRATGIGIWLISQFPNKWATEVFGNIETFFAYPIGNQQDGLVRAYALAEKDFPKQGSFALGHDRWDGWNAMPAVEKLLNSMQPTPWPYILTGNNTPALLPDPNTHAGDGFEDMLNRQAGHPTVTITATRAQADNPHGYTPDDKNRFDELIAAWFGEDPSRLQWRGKGMEGATEVARRIYDQDMNMFPELRDRVWESYKSEAGKYLAAYREAHGMIDLNTPEGIQELQDMADDDNDE